jgi:hypothetical protein
LAFSINSSAAAGEPTSAIAAHRRRQADAARDRALHVAVAGRHDVDEVGIDQKR